MVKKLAGLALGIGLAWGTSVAYADGPIRIGITTPIQLATGKDTVDAARMAVDEINAKGGVLGRPLEIVVADEGTSPETGIAAVQRLIDSDKADVLVGGYVSGVVLAQLPHIAEAGKVYLGVGGSSPQITAQVESNYEDFKGVFRVSPPNAVHQAAQSIEMVRDVVMGELGMKKIAVLMEDAAWAQATMPPIRDGIEKAGGEVVAVESFEVSQNDFSPIMARLSASGAQFVFTLLSASQSESLVKQWQDAQMPFMIGGIHTKAQAADYFERIGGAAATEIAANLVMRAPITELTVPFWDAFVAKTGRTPVYTGPGAYDAVHVFALAAERAGSLDLEPLVEALEATDYVGTNGRIVFGKNHDVRTGPGFANIVFAQWQADGSRPIVSPPGLRSEGAAAVRPDWLK
jgi:branched-chain amino acid transport system substrate-binding protein